MAVTLVMFFSFRWFGCGGRLAGLPPARCAIAPSNGAMTGRFLSFFHHGSECFNDFVRLKAVLFFGPTKRACWTLVRAYVIGARVEGGRIVKIEHRFFPFPCECERSLALRFPPSLSRKAPPAVLRPDSVDSCEKVPDFTASKTRTVARLARLTATVRRGR
jgi:hypothetical protein